MVLEDTPGSSTAVLTVFVNPLVGWIWAGAALLILGVILGSWPGGRRSVERARAVARRPALAGSAE